MAFVKYKNGYFKFGNGKKEFHPWLIVLLGIPLYMIFSLIFLLFRDDILLNYGNKMKAVIIDEQAYEKNSFITKEKVYKYEFNVNGKTYKGHSQCNYFKVGDSIEILYWRFHPKTNQPVWLIENKTCNSSLK
jgi:ribosomal protein S17